MSSDATTLPLRDSLLGRLRAGYGHGIPGERAGADAHARRLARRGTAALALIVAASALIVVIAADRPSLLSAPTHSHFFPGWIAGPLGGLWPGLTRSPAALRALFSCAIVAMYASWIVAIRYASLLRARRVFAAIVAVNVVLMLSPPLALTDVFNYINYARMEVLHHLNPYVTIPVLGPHSDPSYYLSNWHQMLSPYGPLFTMLTCAVVPLGLAGSFWALKAILMLASLGIVGLVWRCAKLLGRDPVQAIVFCGMNPVVLVWGLAGDHNDFFMVLLMMAGFYLLLLGERTLPRSRVDRADGEAAAAQSSSPGRALSRLAALPLGISGLDVAGGVAFAASVAVKASGAIVIPVVLAGLLYARRRVSGFLIGLLGGGLALAACTYAAFGANVPNVSTQSTLVSSLSLPNLFGVAIGQGGETNTLRMIASAVLAVAVAACSVRAWRRRDPITWAGWASVALLVSLGWVLPWYVLWVLPLAALSRSRRLRRTTVLIGAYLILTWAPLFPSIYNAVGFHPADTLLAQVHQREVEQLLH